MIFRLLLALALLALLAPGCEPVEGSQGEAQEQEGARAESAPPSEGTAVAGRTAQGLGVMPAGVSNASALGAHPSLQLLARTLVMVQRRYYAPDRVVPRRMMVHGIDALQSKLPEVVAEFDRPIEEIPERVELRVNRVSRSFDLSKVNALSDITALSSEIMTFLVDSLEEKQPGDDLEYTLINGMLDTLDPHSVLLTPKVYNDMQTSHGGFGGLGIVIGVRDNQLTVISPIEATPAWSAGLRAEDQIVRIGEESTVNMPLHEAVEKLRGEVGTQIEIDILRRGWPAPRTFEITRARIQIRSLITHAIAEDQIAYIKIKSFEKNTGADMRAQIERMRAEMGGEIKGLILDLRFNAGGLLDQAIEVADAFLSEGTIVVSEEFGGQNRRDEGASAEDTEPAYPIVVILNAGSASASEIVAGALKNHDRAVLIGDQTFGKGSVQILSDNDDGSALKLTVAQYLTPGDISIQGTGITPDIRVVPVSITETDDLGVDVDMFISDKIRREGTLELALESDKIATDVEEPVGIVKYLSNPDGDARRDTEAFAEDFEIRLARQMIRDTTSSARPEMLVQVATGIEVMAREEMGRIGEALSSHRVDWREGPEGPTQPFTARLELVDERGAPDADGVVHAGETLTLHATVTNDGAAPLHRLHAVSDSNNPLLDDREFLFGAVAPGETRTWTYRLVVPGGISTRTDTVTLRFGDQHTRREEMASLPVTIKGETPPHYAFNYQVFDGNDGLLQVGEEVELVVWVANTGPGMSGETVVHVKNTSGAAMYLNKGREVIEDLDVGETGRAAMRFEVRGAQAGEAFLGFELTTFDRDHGESLSQTVRMPVLERPIDTEPAEGEARVGAAAEVFAGASEAHAGVIAHVVPGQIVERVARTVDGQLVQIRWSEASGEARGWVRAARLEAINDEGGPVADLDLELSHTAPTITFNAYPLEHSGDRVTLSGVITDDSQVIDYYVYLWHQDGQRTHASKLDYQIAEGAEKTFTIDVPLRSGVNRVTVFARDDDKLESRQAALIHHP